MDTMVSNNSIAGFQSDFGAYMAPGYDPSGLTSTIDDPNQAFPDLSGDMTPPTGSLGPAPKPELNPFDILQNTQLTQAELDAGKSSTVFSDGGNVAQTGVFDVLNPAANTATGRGAATNDTMVEGYGATTINRSNTPQRPPSQVNTTGGVLGRFAATLRDIGRAASGTVTAQTNTNINNPNGRAKVGGQLVDNTRESNAMFGSFPALVAVGAVAYLALKG